MHKTQRGQKLRRVKVKLKVLIPLNVLTLPSFSVTSPSCHLGGLCCVSS